MPRYRYKAAAADGSVTEGETDAVNRDALIRRLQADGQVPLDAREVSGAAPRRRRWAAGGRRVGRHDLTAITAQLATLLEAGMGLDRALAMLTRISEREPVRALLARIHAAVREGKDLSTALGIAREAVANRHVAAALVRVTEQVREGGGLARPLAQARVFPQLVAQMLEVGEESDGLDAILARLAEVYEREVRARARCAARPPRRR